MSHRHTDVGAAMRAQQALALRRDGETSWEEIAKQCGYPDKGSACKAVTRLLQQVKYEGVSEYRTLLGMRLEMAFKAVWRDALGSVEVSPEGGTIIHKGDLWALDRALAIIALQIKLFGLAIAPEDAEIAVTREVRFIAEYGFTQETYNQI